MKDEKVPEKELKNKITSKNEASEETNPEKNPINDEEDLLYTQKPENRDSSMRWNSTFCRKPGY
jgi:hypothetical protein